MRLSRHTTISVSRQLLLRWNRQKRRSDMKAVGPHEQTGGERNRECGDSLPSAENRPVLTSRQKRYLIWGPIRLVLGVIQMTFVAVAILNVIFVGLSPSALICAAIATTATVVSRVLFHGRRTPPP